MLNCILQFFFYYNYKMYFH